MVGYLRGHWWWDISGDTGGGISQGTLVVGYLRGHWWWDISGDTSGGISQGTLVVGYLKLHLSLNETLILILYSSHTLISYMDK